MRKFFCFTLLLFFTQGYLHAQSADSLVRQGLSLEKHMQESLALKKYNEAIQQDSANLVALHQAAILSVREGKRQKTRKAAVAYFNRAKLYASKAVDLNPNNKESLLAMASAVQQLSLHAGAKEKASYLKATKSYLDKALQIDSTYGRAWHLLGNWNDEVSQMNFAERAAMKLLFGGLPDASLDAAILNYKKCLRLDPSYIRNYYDLGRAYHQKEEDIKAIAILKQAIRLRPIQQDDRAIQQECKKMLESLQ